MNQGVSISAAGNPGDFGFGRQCRLLTPAQFAEVFATRQVLRGAHFVLHYRPNQQPGARLGLAIPKKQARAAVLRNAVKRQARELFRRNHHGLPAMDVVLRLARPLNQDKTLAVATAAAERAAWRTEITSLLGRLAGKAAA